MRNDPFLCALIIAGLQDRSARTPKTKPVIILQYPIPVSSIKIPQIKPVRDTIQTLDFRIVQHHNNAGNKRRNRNQQWQKNRDKPNIATAINTTK